MTHEHSPHKIVKNRPGLATVACQCGKLVLIEYGNQFLDYKSYEALNARIKELRKLRK